jgi:hypothetical protein
MLVCAVFFSLLSSLAAAGSIELPKTGQQSCYDAAGTEIVCAGTGQDGEIQAGVAWPDPRFSVGLGNEADCITDTLTGLMWVKTPDSTTRDWQEAIDYAKTLNLCGFTDWRVPTIVELESMVNTEQSNSASWLNTQGFSNVQSSIYWSSTTKANIISVAWFVSMHYGFAFYGDLVNDGKAGSHYVWPVRGGQTAAPAEIWESGQNTSYYSEDDGALQPGLAWPSPRFTINDNTGTVTDNLTGLIWLKNANCFGKKTWDQALASANGLANGQCGLSDGSHSGDWRLPNRKELLSLVDFEYFDMALSNTAGTGKWSGGDPFDNVLYFHYWSSTTDADETNYAWSVLIRYGYVVGEVKTDGYYVWPVRGGQSGSLNTLTISKAGTGTGTVTSDPAGINCGDDCSETYAENTEIALTAQADAGSTFAGWSGDADCSGGAVTMNSDVNCTATFTLNTYSLTVNKTGTGSGTVGGGGTYNYGTSHDITAVAAAGSTFSGWSGACTGINPTCHITMDTNKSVTAHFLAEGTTSFNDVPSGYWAWNYIEALLNNNITSGCGGGNYCPESLVTRGQMAVFLLKALGETPASSCGHLFSDVDETTNGKAVFCRYIEKFSTLGITAGCGNNNFCPNDPVSRMQMAVFITKALGETMAATCGGTFNDVDETTGGNVAFCKYIEKFATLGITSGCGNGNFCPDSPVTRAQMAVFLTKGFLQ